MFEIFRYRVLFATFDIEQYQRAREILKECGIPYITDIKNMNHARPGMSSFGESFNRSIIYQLSVKNKYYDQAKSLTGII